MKKLFEENQHLKEVNKNLADKLEQAQREKAQDVQPLHEKKRKKRKSKDGHEWFAHFIFIGFGICVHGCIIIN